MNAVLVYRSLLAVRGCWLVVEWFFGWNAFSQISTFSLSHPFATLIRDVIVVGLWLALLLGMWFFQRWARWIFVILPAVALLAGPFIVHRYSLSASPSFVPSVNAFILMLIGGIIAMSFLPPVRDRFVV